MYDVFGDKTCKAVHKQNKTKQRYKKAKYLVPTAFRDVVKSNFVIIFNRSLHF